MVKRVLICALYEKVNGEALMFEPVAACDVMAVAYTPKAMVEQLRYWAELNAPWPVKLRRDLEEKLTAWANAREYQVRYEVPIGEDDKMRLVFQFGVPDAGA